MRLLLLVSLLLSSAIAFAADRQINQISVEQSDSDTIIRLYGSGLIRSQKDRLFFAAEASSYSHEPMMMYGDEDYVEVALAMKVEAGQYRISIGPNENTATLESMVVIGAIGPRGEQGPAGRDGVDGRDGADGSEGAKGPQGKVGPRGERGLEGPVGPRGEMGLAGADGADGAQGPQGPQGLMGPPGATGAQGPQGLMGPQGPAGPQGPQGPMGETGPQGPPGEPAIPMENVIWVSKSGGDFSSIEYALSTITDASETNPYLIRVGPGVFDEGAYNAKDHVYLKGSGRGVTVMRGQDSFAVIRGGMNTGLSDVSIETYSVNGSSVGVELDSIGGGKVSISNIDVSASGGDDTKGLWIYDPIDLSGVTISNSSFFASGDYLSIGISIEGFSGNDINLTLEDVSATAEGGSYQARGIYARMVNDMTWQGVTAHASGSSGANQGVFLDGQTSVNASDLEATATGSGDSQNIGLFVLGRLNAEKQPRFVGLISKAQGGATAQAALLLSSRATISAASFDATGARVDNVGLWNVRASPELLNITVSSDQNQSNGRSLAIFNEISSSPIVMGSILKGGVDGSIENLSGELEPSAALLSGSVLFGDVRGNGFTCQGVTSGQDRIFLDAACGRN